MFACQMSQPEQYRSQNLDEAERGSYGGVYVAQFASENQSQFGGHLLEGDASASHHRSRRVGKPMNDAATMTETAEDSSSTPSWPGSNHKVDEYLSSFRHFLKMSPPSKGVRSDDVQVVNSVDGTRLFCCPECHVAYPEMSLLELHLATHKAERRFVCGVCGVSLKRKEHLDRHQLSHSNERPYSCAVCSKTFKRNEHLARHYVVHTGDKAQVCRECGKAFHRKDHLRKHAAGHFAKRLRLESDES